jgi:hypothetical protein
LRYLLRLLNEESRREFWEYLHLQALDFAALGLTPDATDRAVWRRCQQEQLLLLTANRNAEGPDSLEATLQDECRPDSLPVFTLADAGRFLRDRAYAEQAADKLLEDLFDIEHYRGVGRLYLPR